VPSYANQLVKKYPATGPENMAGLQGR